MIEAAALAVVIAVGVFLFALGAAAFLAPAHAGSFLLGFAGSPTKHYLELALRLLAGGAFVISAPVVALAGGFTLFGWLLLGTTMVLLLVPWRWHHRFAQRAVPEALRFLPFVGVSSTLMGGLILWAVWRGNLA
ncbi:hypothetical protein [Arenimonas aestuarii]